VFVFLARVIAFLIAVSVIRSVVDYVKRLWQGTTQQSRPFPRVRPNTPVGDTPSATLLQQDPVCGTYVAVDTSLKKIVAGRVYYFCSDECRNKFHA
jgi:uncharacterized protein